jgi:predicted FMN-binding regulatory protein PaiB
MGNPVGTGVFDLHGVEKVSGPSFWAADSGWSIDALPPAQRAGAMSAIQSFHLKIERVEAKFKLSQNKSQQDRDRVIERLRGFDSNSDLVQWMTRQGAKPKN